MTIPPHEPRPLQIPYAPREDGRSPIWGAMTDEYAHPIAFVGSTIDASGRTVFRAEFDNSLWTPTRDNVQMLTRYVP